MCGLEVILKYISSLVKNTKFIKLKKSLVINILI